MKTSIAPAVASILSACLTLLFSYSPASGQWASAPKMNPDLPTLWIIGDSTVRNGSNDDGGNGQWGWGNPIASYFDTSKINVQNRAVGGTSSRSYMSAFWPKVLPEMKAGDFLIMQFGHNDSGPLDDPARARGTIAGNGEETKEIDNPITKQHEVVHTYGWYLRKYITDAKTKGVTQVVICSPIPRNSWGKDGKVNRNGKYTSAAMDAAKTGGAEFINLNELTSTRYDAEGQQKVTDTYFPDKEVTHTDWAGAVLNADIVVTALKTMENNDLKKFLLPEPPKDLKNPSGKAR